MKVLKTALLCFVTVLSVSLFAQRKADAVIPYEQDIQNILLNPATGQVIVKEKDKISAYNPESKQNEWQVTMDEIGKMGTAANAKKALDALSSPDLMKVFESSDQLRFIPESPYIRCVFGDKDVILNAIDGKIIFNSGTKDYRILRSEFLPGEDNFLFIATDGKVFNCILYDLKSGNEKWISRLADVAGFISQFGSSFSGGVPSQDQLSVTNQYIYTSINSKLYKLDKEDGKILWNTNQLTSFFLSQTEKDIIIIKNATGGLLASGQAVNILNAETGKTIWKDDIKTQYISYIEDWSDRILIAHSKGFNFYSYQNGAKIWKKDAKGNAIKQVIPIDQDYLYIADKEMNLIDKDGNSKWKNFIEISDNSEDPVYYLGKIDNNRVFYLTATYGNMVDYASGKKLWKKNIEFEKDKPLLYAFDEKANAFMVYNNKKIFKFDPNIADKPEPIAKLKDVNEDKNMSGIELFDWGICLVGQSDIIGVGFDGETKYHNTYKEPGGGKRKFMKVSGMIGSSALGLASATSHDLANAQLVVQHRDANGNLIQSGSDLLSRKSKAKAETLGDATGAASAAISATLLSRVSDRYNALKHNNTYAFVLTKGEKGETTQLVKVKKADGVEVDKISVDNNQPIYEVDPVTDDVFYVYKNELRIFSNK